MGRYSDNPSYRHHCRRMTCDDYEIGWWCDRYYEGCRQRFPTRTSRWTDEKGARRFCKKWGIAFPEDIK